MKLPKKGYLQQTVRREKNGTWTAYRYVLVAATGQPTKMAAIQEMRKFPMRAP